MLQNSRAADLCQIEKNEGIGSHQKSDGRSYAGRRDRLRKVVDTVLGIRQKVVCKNIVTEVVDNHQTDQGFLGLEKGTGPEDTEMVGPEADTALVVGIAICASLLLSQTLVLFRALGLILRLVS